MQLLFVLAVMCSCFFPGFPQCISYLSFYSFLPHFRILQRSFHTSIQPSTYQLTTLFDSCRLETYAGHRGGRQTIPLGILWTLHTLGTLMVLALLPTLAKTINKMWEITTKGEQEWALHQGWWAGGAGEAEAMPPSRTWPPSVQLTGVSHSHHYALGWDTELGDLGWGPAGLGPGTRIGPEPPHSSRAWRWRPQRGILAPLPHQLFHVA